MPKESCVFLPSLDDQRKYLIAKGYFPQGTTLSDDDRDMLACSNFHYLLGYFRNYNKYKSEGLLPENPGISDVLDIVRMDVEVSSLLYGYMRQSEQAIRATWVDVFCTYRSPHEYLNPDAYICMNQDRPVDALIKDMMRHILRYREPYVRERAEEWWKSCAKSSSKTPSENLDDWEDGSSPVEWCNRFVSFGVGYALSWSGGSSCWVGWGVSRDLVRMSRLR